MAEGTSWSNPGYRSGCDHRLRLHRRVLVLIRVMMLMMMLMMLMVAVVID